MKTKIIVLGLYLLSLGNPNSQLDSTLLMVLAGLVLGNISYKNIKLWISITTLLFTSYLYSIISAYSTNLPVNILIMLFGFFTGNMLEKYKKNRFILWLLILIYTTTSIFNSSKLREYLNTNPEPESYIQDMGLYQKTYFLMKQTNYYQAHKQAFEERGFSPTAPKDAWSWRLPTIFYIWKAFSSITGGSIFFLYLIISSIGLYTTYQYSYKVLPSSRKYLAILLTSILLPYFHFAARDWTILQVEWWSVLFVIIGLWQYSIKRHKTATLLFSLSIMTRELMLIPFGIIFGLYLILKKINLKKITPPKQWWIFLIPIISFATLLALHLFFINQTVGLKENALSPRLHGGFSLINQTLAFNSWEYLLYSIRPFLILLITSIIGLTLSFTFESIFVLCFLLLPGFFLTIGTSLFNEYWGILYVPIIPLGLSWFLKYLFSSKKSL